MQDPTTLDELLAEIMGITARIEDASTRADEREQLEDRREELRRAARRAGDRARSEAGLRNELGTLTNRLTEIRERPIGKGWTEKTSYRWFNDPGAYSSQINRLIEDQDEDESEAISARIADIKAVLAGRSDDDSTGPAPTTR